MTASCENHLPTELTCLFPPKIIKTYFLSFPSRAIESHSSVHRGAYHSPFSLGYLYSQYVVLFCLLLVCFAIALYLHRLKR